MLRGCFDADLGLHGSTSPDDLGGKALRKEFFALARHTIHDDFVTVHEPDVRLLITTFADQEAASAVVRQLLEERLIACGTLLPGALSLYRWEGKIEESSEVIALMKTDQERSTRCMARLKEMHPYDVPEIILLEPEAVSGVYASWVREALEKANTEG